MRELLKSGVTTIHVLGHGQPGQVELAGYILDGDAWESIAADLEAASHSGDSSSFDSNNSNPHRADGAPNNEKIEINFWSCQTGEGTMGRNYTQRVANLCDAKVNASSSLVGHETMGGNWELDVMSYPRVPFSQSARNGFEQVLDHDGYNGGTGSISGTPISINQSDLDTYRLNGALDPQYNYSVAQVDLTTIVELANSPYVSSISLASSLVGNALTNLTADQFAAITGGKVEQLTSSLAVSDSAQAFLQVFDEQALEQLVADFEQIKVADPSAVMPTFSADLSGANPFRPACCIS